MPFTLLSRESVRQYLEKCGCSVELFDFFVQNAAQTFQELMVSPHYSEQDFVKFVSLLNILKEKAKLEECQRKDALVTLNCVHRGCQDKNFKRHSICNLECKQIALSQIKVKKSKPVKLLSGYRGKCRSYGKRGNV